jgi:hypothetical protein
MSSKKKSWVELDNEETTNNNNNNNNNKNKKSNTNNENKNNKLTINTSIINKPILEIYEYKLSSKNNEQNLWFTTISKNEKCGIIKDENEYKENMYHRSCDLMDAKINYEKKTENTFDPPKHLNDIDFRIDVLTDKIFARYPSRISDNNLNKLFHRYQDIFKNKDNNFSILKSVLSNIHKSMDEQNATDISRVKTYRFLEPGILKMMKPRKYRSFMHERYESFQSQPNSFHIQKLIIPDKSVIFFCGDTHGSVHTTMRNILRLKYSGIINNDFKIIKPNFYMIFLGDIIDYGYLGYENLMTILLLKLNNHDKVFIVQGNHEEYYQHWPEYWENHPSQGRFGKELKLKFKDILNELTFHIEKLFMKLPSAICVRSKSDSQWIWCCHGGLPIPYEGKSLDILDFLENKKKFFLPIKYEYAKLIKWNDFQSELQNKPENRMAIGINLLKEYMTKNNIGFIMRGHQDQHKNTKLLSSPDFTIEKYTMIDINESEQKWRKKCTKSKALTNIIDFGNRNLGLSPEEDKTAETYLYRINTSEFDKTYKRECKLYPVLTLTTATDRGKYLNRDSFTLLRYDINIKNWKKNKLGYILSIEKQIEAHRLEFKTKITERAHRLGLAKDFIPKVPTTGGKTRKHQGIHQSGGKKGKLKKGYRYSGKKLKSGISQIIKCKRKK